MSPHLPSQRHSLGRVRSEPAPEEHAQSCAQQSLFQPGSCQSTPARRKQTKQPQAKVLRAQVLRPSPPGHGQAATGVGTVGAAATPTRAGIQELGWDGDGVRGASMGPLSGSQPRQRRYRLGRDGRGGLTAWLPLGSSLRLRTSLAPGMLSFLRRPRRLRRSKHPPKRLTGF